MIFILTLIVYGELIIALPVGGAFYLFTLLQVNLLRLLHLAIKLLTCFSELYSAF